MIFPPVLLLSSYLNINGFKTDAAGISAAWSGLYLLLAMRRKQVSYLQLTAAIKDKDRVLKVFVGLTQQIWSKRCDERSYARSLCC